ncbi:hypothetical protein AMTRI_Chr07g76080 [Amborella trichopoda]
MGRGKKKGEERKSMSEKEQEGVSSERKGEEICIRKKRKWEEMEGDCLMNIFRRLDAEDLVMGARMVCKSWKKACSSTLYWETVNVPQRIDGPKMLYLADRLESS